MADAGYDVWMPNWRGNYYSRRHISLSPNERQFWNFSWDDIAFNDLPAVHNYAIKVTGVPKLFIIGHSQGKALDLNKLKEKCGQNIYCKL